MELANYLVHDPLLVLHRKEPDGQFPGLELGTKLLALDTEEGRANLVAILLVMLLGDGDRLVVEQASVCHLDGGAQTVIVGHPLLGTKDVKRLLDDGIPGEVFLPAFFRFLLKVFRHHLWPMDNGYVEFTHTNSFQPTSCPDRRCASFVE